MKHKRAAAGFSLIEIMVALTVGAVLLAGVLQVFVNSKQTSRLQNNLSLLQENARLALDTLSMDIRNAGYIGCNRSQPIHNTLNMPGGFLYNFSQAIQGFEATSGSAWTPALDSSFSSPQGGSDIITLRRADSQSFTITGQATNTDPLTLDATATNDNLTSAGFLDSASGNNDCMTALIANCSSATVFQVSAITGTALSHDTGGSCAPGNLTNDLGQTFVGAKVMAINTISYYVDTRAGSQGTPSLYRKIGSSPAQELVEGIEQMQITYSVDSDVSPDGAGNTYLSANNVTDMRKVVAVRVSLLVTTLDDNIATQPVTYLYDGVEKTAADNRIKRVFTTTIAVRNRLP